ncbi:uncharacterized protein EHS24_003437 [Apiotrichum porosum]|uniref:Agmatine deiminase n=1 Tax=Apiotrichum porosum TaxID=105984 RepID=A0A427XF26_9TREE|nr:uncharacterized protein EHS24_003437 [Apiotrichum porosum]RSH77465.1 hypothetical protein EHS24_003437 [Apiotrichum porosum]
MLVKTLLPSLLLALPCLAQDSRWGMPDEGQPHNRTWMAFAASANIWGDTLDAVRKDLATIAQTIAQFEPVSMLVRQEDLSTAQEMVGSSVNLVVGELDDLWMRDTGPVFVKNVDNGTIGGVNFNFNGWGNKQEHGNDSKVAAEVDRNSTDMVVSTTLVLEGGALEVDGEGTAIITESCVLNENRNPGWTKENVTEELSRLLNLTKIIWLPGIAGKDITDGHTDFYARFASPGVVFAGFEPDTSSFDHDVTTQHLEILRNSTDAAGRTLDVVVLNAPGTIRPTTNTKDFAAGYINFYQVNGAIIGPEFGDNDTDSAAKAAMEKAFPGKTIVQINIDAIAAGGGGIHCTTQQEPAFGATPAAGNASATVSSQSSANTSAGTSTSGSGHHAVASNALFGFAVVTLVASFMLL